MIVGDIATMSCDGTSCSGVGDWVEEDDVFQAGFLIRTSGYKAATFAVNAAFAVSRDHREKDVSP
jgi:hypothetical protein